MGLLEHNSGSFHTFLLYSENLTNSPVKKTDPSDTKRENDR